VLIGPTLGLGARSAFASSLRPLAAMRTCKHNS
jgi:hypothetical protein